MVNVRLCTIYCSYRLNPARHSERDLISHMEVVRSAAVLGVFSMRRKHRTSQMDASNATVEACASQPFDFRNFVVMALVPLLLLLLRRARVIRGLGLAEICGIGLLLHAPALMNSEIAITISVASNIALIMRLQEVHAAGEKLAQPGSAEPDGLDRVAMASSGARTLSMAASTRSQHLPRDPPHASMQTSSRERTASTSADGASSVRLPKLSEEESMALTSGAMVLKTMAVAQGNEGLAVQRVEAPADLVWATILDFGEWPRMVDDVVAASVYERQGGEIKVKITIGVGFLKLHTYVHHVLDKVAGTLTWSLDAAKPSDLLGNTGYWIVRDGPKGSRSCTVYYSCKVQLRSWAPGWLDRYIAREGLPRALGWLKREAEARGASETYGRAPRRSLSSPDLAELDAGAGEQAASRGSSRRSAACVAGLSAGQPSHAARGAPPSPSGDADNLQGVSVLPMRFLGAAQVLGGVGAVQGHGVHPYGFHRRMLSSSQ